MNEVWDLNPIYRGFDDPAFEADMQEMTTLVEIIGAYADGLLGRDYAVFEDIFERLHELGHLRALRDALLRVCEQEDRLGAVDFSVLQNRLLELDDRFLYVAHVAHLFAPFCRAHHASGYTRLSMSEKPVMSSTSFTDGLPQALILTAIVINFAVTGLFLVVAYRSYRVLGTDDMNELRGNEDE